MTLRPWCCEEMQRVSAAHAPVVHLHVHLSRLHRHPTPDLLRCGGVPTRLGLTFRNDAGWDGISAPFLTVRLLPSVPGTATGSQA